VAFSPCGRLLALTHRGRDRLDTITVYELCTGQRRLEFAPRNQVTALTFAADSSLLASGHGSGTALVWDLTVEVPRPAPDADKCWRDLAGDARVAYRALLALRQWPAQAVKLVQTHVRPARGKELRAAQVAALIQDLDADDFEKRERATATLKAR